MCLTIDDNNSTIKGVNVSLWVSLPTCAEGSETFVPSADRKIRSGHNQHTCFAAAAPCACISLVQAPASTGKASPDDSAPVYAAA